MRGDDAALRDRLLDALDMFEFGVEMMAANLRRRHPNASPDELERLLDAWLAARPGPRFSDDEDAPADSAAVMTKST